MVASYYSNYPSPDSRFVAFSKTNAKGVQHVRFPIYGKEDYATILDYEYPKVILLSRLLIVREIVLKCFTAFAKYSAVELGVYK